MSTIGYRAEIDAGRRFVEEIEPDDSVVLVFHGDADGCAAGAIFYHTLHAMGCELVFPVFLGKGESIYDQSFAERVMAHDPNRLIVADTGSRTRAILPGVTTLVVDHHQPAGVPPVDVFVNSYAIDPPASSAVVAYQICKDLVAVDGRSWLAAIGAAGDLGVEANIELLRDARSTYGVKAIQETVALVNAARRSASHDVAAAFQALVTAESPLDIAEHSVPAATVLASYREEVNSEFKRVVRTAPKIVGEWALIRFASPDLIHPLVAIAWTRRLRDSIVIAANEGYTPGRVHFSMRSVVDINLQRKLREAHPAGADLEFAYGHERATGGVLSTEDFAAFIATLGFTEEQG